MMMRLKPTIALLACILAAGSMLSLALVLFPDRLSVRGLAAAILLASIAGLALLYLVVRPMLPTAHRIEATLQRIAEGDLSARTEIRPPGELGELCQAIDAMADAIAHREEQREAAARQQVGRSEKLASIGRLAAGVAHEINNPLTGVLTFAHLLRDKPALDAEDREDVDTIIHETTRAATIVRGLLDFARESTPRKQPVSLNEAVYRTLRLLGNQKIFRQITVVENLRQDLPMVDGDVNQLQQVVLNLTLNACEAMPDGGTLILGTALRDNGVALRVSDTGCGIPEKYLDHVFEPFFSTKPVGKGTGLGLSVSHGIVEQHGGTMTVESVEGRGTTFTVLLPAAEVPATASES